MCTAADTDGDCFRSQNSMIVWKSAYTHVCPPQEFAQSQSISVCGKPLKSELSLALAWTVVLVWRRLQLVLYLACDPPTESAEGLGNRKVSDPIMRHV